VADPDPDDAAARQVLREEGLAFEEDLQASFGDRSTDFEGQLRAHLFELWSVARKRPAALNLAKGVLREELDARFAQLLGKHLDDTKFVQQLERVLLVTQFGHQMENWPIQVLNLGATLELEVNTEAWGPRSATAQLPELVKSGTEDDTQRILRERMQHEGMWPTQAQVPEDWAPVYINRETGEICGLDNAGRIVQHPIDTLLVGDGHGTWTFPQPRPRPRQPDPFHEHITLYVDGQLQHSPNLHFLEEYSSTAYQNEIVSVSGLFAATVRAVYTVARTAL